MESKNKLIGIDIGGTKINFACVQAEDITCEVISLKTPGSAQGILDTLCREIEDLAGQHHVKAIGIATAGTVNLENSKVTGSTGNLPAGYLDLEIKKVLEEKFSMPVFLENDANASAYAEFKAGNAKGHMNTITLTLGTGIGGGIIAEGRLIRGRTGSGAEVGHMPMTPEKKRKCTCGSWDCWEAYASGTGYVLTAREMAGKIPAENRKGILKDRNIPELTTYDVIAGLKNNDSFAVEVHNMWEEYLAMGMASLINIFEPDSVVLSGGMAKFVNYGVLAKKIRERTLTADTRLLPAKFENFAGILGAAYLADQKFFK